MKWPAESASCESPSSVKFTVHSSVESTLIRYVIKPSTILAYLVHKSSVIQMSG